MPFAVIERETKGNRELSVVPDSWLRCFQGVDAVLWPNESPSELETLIRDENSCPDSFWRRYKCTVKRHLIPSYNQAMKLLEMIAAREKATIKIQHEKQSQIFIQTETSRSNIATPTPQANINSLPVITAAYSAVKAEPAQFESNYEVQDVVAEDPIQKCLDKMDLIISMQQQINKRLDALEMQVAGISDQSTAIFHATVEQESHCTTEIEETLSFNFTAMESEQELDELEQNLQDKKYREKMIKWLRVNVYGNCAEDRMLCVLDLLFSKRFQTMCTWTGLSRKGPKTAIGPNRNILELFQILGSNDKEVVNPQELTAFFMKKLKNSLKRMSISGVRRSTKHVRRRNIKRPRPAENHADDDDSSLSEAELDDGFTYVIENLSDTNDNQDQTISVSISPSNSEHNFDPHFVIKME